MLNSLENCFSEPVRSQLFQARGLVYRYLNAGNRHYCAVCDHSSRKFLSAGIPARPNVRCSVCGSLERHRFDWTFLQLKTDLFDGSKKRMLHVAPERAYQYRLKRLGYLDYVTADISSPAADVKMDITALAFPDDSFSAIYCSHVLEHVLDDASALREFYRVLKPGAWAVLQVPITRDKTFEDPTITEPSDRRRVFGQEDHVRHCGPDYIDRIRAAGFTADSYGPRDVLGDEADYDKLGFSDRRILFYCTKPAH